MGATESVNRQYILILKTVLLNLKQRVIRFLLQIRQAKVLLVPDFKPNSDEKLALVFGNEVDGVGNDTLVIVMGNIIELPATWH